MHLAGYRIDRFLTRTRLSRLYQGWDLVLHRSVVIKLFALDPNCPVAPLSPQQWRQRFIREGVALAALEHPNIVPALHGGQLAGGRPYMVLPFYPANLPGLIGFDVERSHFDQVSEAEKPKALAVAPSVQILGQLFAALVHVHGRGMVHRDIKPQNVLLTSRQTLGVRLCDFGMVKMAGEADLLPGEWIGTPAYMAPEQKQDARHASGQSDVYSVCVLGYRMLTGFLPALNQPMAQPVPQSLINLLQAGMQDDPALRPTARQALDQLLQIRSHIQ